jgi:hypothetical protein
MSSPSQSPVFYYPSNLGDSSQWKFAKLQILTSPCLWAAPVTSRRVTIRVHLKVFSRNLMLRMKNAVFWDVAPCRCGRLNRRFGGSYRLHLQGRKILEWRTCLLVLHSRIFLPWRCRRYDPPKRRFNRPHLHGATSQKTAFFIVTAVKTSNPT